MFWKISNLHYLLPDTKLTKNIIQLIFRGYFAGYLAQVIQAAAYIQEL